MCTAMATVLTLQSCAFTPNPPDPIAQQTALERWNRCLQRFEAKTEHFCDGYRRDILTTYPHHLENQLNTLLSQQLNTSRATRLVKTGIATALNDTDRNVQGSFMAGGGEAQKSDL